MSNPSTASAPPTGALHTVTRPLQKYLEDPRVTEILLNPDGTLWVDRAGEGMSATDTRMTLVEIDDFLRHVAAESETTLTRSKPTFSGTLPHWDARVQGWIPPVVSGPSFTVRKPSPIVRSLDEYVDKGVLTGAQRDVLIRAVLDRKNILVGGGTGTGKTTFANALLQVIAERTNDRLYTIEDTRELQCPAPNKVPIKTIPGVYDATAAAFDAWRARPDRIIVGELRDGTAHVVLKAWNSGHPGGVATLHADDPPGMLDRFCDLVEERVFPAPRRSVAATINICVHLTLDPSSPAGRRLSGLARVVGYDRSAERWLLESLI